MNRSRFAATAGGVVTLLLTAGTALALAVGGEAASPALAGAGTGGTTSETTATTAGSTTESTVGSGTPTANPGFEVIDSALAAQIALGYTGGGTVTEVEREFEHGRVEWKVRILTGGRRLDVRVDAETGAITRVDVNGGEDVRDDDGDDNGGDDNSGHGSDDGDDSDDGGHGSDDGDDSGDDGHDGDRGGDSHDDASGDDRGGRG